MIFADASSRLQCRRGFALNTVLVLITLALLLASTAVFLTVTDEWSAASAQRRARLAVAADAVVAEMQELLLARAQSASGALGEADMVVMNTTAIHDLNTPAGGLDIDARGTGWRIIAVRAYESLPHDEAPIALWTDQPRTSFAEIPPVGGLVASRTLVIAVYATIRDRAGGVFRVRRDLAISQVPPHQHALYTAGDAELCASRTPSSSISGPVRVDGTLFALSCANIIRYTGGIEARDGILTSLPSSHFVLGTDGPEALTSVSGAEAVASAAQLLARWAGRVRVSSAFGGAIGRSRLSDAEVAGSGECDDVPAAGGPMCGGAARYYPSIQVQRTSSGEGRDYTAICGAAYDEGCTDALKGIAYEPWPFTSPQTSGMAATNPASPPFPWHGVLPDARREARCTATVATVTYRTARCPTNLYGFRIDVGALPALAGGMLSIRKASGQPPGANPSGSQEIVLLTNATALAGPLTIHSEIPVYVAGSFNTAFRAAWNGPPPAKIHAPRVVILPNESLAQLQTSAVWDSVPRAGSAIARAEPLRAESNVTIYAVIRAGYCRSSAGAYFGGVWEGVPSVLGDWSAASLRIIGSIEGRDASADAPGCATYAAPVSALPPSGTPTSQPASRTLLFDERLLHPFFQPPGGWSSGNMPAAGGPFSIPGRTPTRQLRALGGTVVVRRVRDEARGLPPIPASVEVPPPSAYPAPPLPLP